MMCDDRDRDDRFRRDRRHEHERRHEHHGDRYRDEAEWDALEDSDFESDDPIDWLKATITEITDEAFHELVFEKVKKRLDKAMGERIDDVAEVVVDYFVRQREREMQAMADEMELDQALLDRMTRAARKKK